MIIPAQQLDISGIRTRSALAAAKAAISAAAGDAGPVSRAVTVAGALPPEAPAVKGVDISAGIPSISCASGMSLTRLKGGGIKKTHRRHLRNRRKRSPGHRRDMAWEGRHRQTGYCKVGGWACKYRRSKSPLRSTVISKLASVEGCGLHPMLQNLFQSKRTTYSVSAAAVVGIICGGVGASPATELLGRERS